MSEQLCPICGSKDIERKITVRVFEDAFGSSGPFEEVNYFCHSCEAEGDFFDENEPTQLTAISNLQSSSVKSILEKLASTGLSFSSIERVLELPQRTLSKWKHNHPPSATGVALLKYIKTFPWLLDVAGANFDYNVSQKIMISHAVNSLLCKTDFSENQPSGSFFFAADGVSGYAVKSTAAHDEQSVNSMFSYKPALEQVQ